MKMMTVTGVEVDPSDLKVEEINLFDIAHSLAMQCRFGGHIPRFYSVAEHCVLMSLWVPREDALAALLHDATEAYVSDVVKPVKLLLPDFQSLEHKVALAITARFGVDIATLPLSVREADHRIIADERLELAGLESRSGRVPLGVPVFGWGPEEAREQYLERFLTLSGDWPF